MTARTGLSTLISQMRGLSNLGTSDYALGTATYWTDDQIQIVLDNHRTDIFREELDNSNINYVSSGSIEYKDYRSRFFNLEQTTGGTAIFIVENAAGTNIGTDTYSVDYSNGIVTFTTDQIGTAYFLTARSYDLNAAAADCWRMKAGAYGEAVNFSTDNMRVNRGDLIKNCLLMADYYSGLQDSKVVDLARDDCL